MIGVRKLSPGGYAYLTGSVACADRELEPGESLSDYYLAHGYPPGQWFGRAAAELGMSGEVTAAQMNALYGTGRHPDGDRIQAEMIATGASETEALAATKLGHRFYQYDGADQLRSAVIAAYKQHNLDHDRPVGAPIDDDTRARIRRDIQAQAYAAAHNGQQPSAADLTRWLAQQKRAMKSATSGYELVCAPPKSVSVAWALADQPTRELIVGLHRQAVRDTLTYLENNVAYTRKGDGGYAQHDVKGIAAAIFEHWDSRAGDPHLHTHVPISAKVQSEDGRWTSLDGRTILAASVTMSEFFNSRIRDLFREHGATWTERPAGGFDLKRPVWELDGVPKELLTGFSARASQVEQDRAARIVAFCREHGREPTPKETLELSRRAQYGTRDAKQAPRSLAAHLRRWRGQASEMIAPEVLDNLGQRVFGGEPEALSEVDVAELATATRLTVSDHYSHFNAWNIEAEAHRQTAHLRVADGGRDQLIADVVHAVIHCSDTVALQAPPLVDEPSALRRSSGESVFVEHNSQRYTTHQTLREETALAAWGRLTDGRRLSRSTVNQALARARRLNAGQRAAVGAFATSGRRVQLLYAPAGAGKTTTMKVYAEAVRAEGGRVFAFGPSARAAQELGQAIDATPHTLHQVTTALKLGVAGQAFPFARGDVMLIDEAAMAGTHTLYDVVAYALRRGADVRFVGDDKQLAAVEAGGAVRWFEHINGAVRLEEVVRFTDPDQAAASLKLREGNNAGLDFYFAKGWVQGGSRETMRDAAHRAWRADLDAGRQSLLIVPTTEDVVQLNLQARALRLDRGDVDGGRAVQLHDGTTASRGDWIVTRHNDRLKTLFGGKDFVKNGDTWDVVRVRRDGSLKVRHRDSHGAIVLPARYVAQHVELAYASTVNRVQGMNSRGTAHGMVTQGMSLEQFYPLATRAIHDNRLYVETHQHTIDSHQETPLEQTPRAVLETVLTRSSAETPATEELRASLVSVESLRTLVGHHDYVALLGTEERVDAVLTEHAPTLLERPATPALRQTLRNAEALGWQAEQLVTTALATGRLDGDDVGDPAAVLQWRIQQRVIREQPPERTAAPTMAAINHWRTIIEQHDPTAAVEDPVWMTMWQHAAAAADEGLNSDAAVASAARQLAARPGNDPMDAHRFAISALDTELRQQRSDGAGWRPVLPWLASPNHTRLADEPGPADYLQRLESTIHARLTELRATVTADPPRWTAGLGPRSLDDPAAAERWDHVATLGAAYRDTYNVTTNDPRRPIGEEPDGQGLKARAWRQLIDQWASPDSGSDPDVGHTRSEAEHNVLDRLRADVDPDELLAALAADEMFSAEPHEERLSDLTHRYRRGVWAANDHHRDEQIHRVLAERAPQIYGHNAEGALLWLLRQAHDLGWNIEQVVPDTDSLSGLDHVTDPAAVLFRRVQDRVERDDPPGAAQRSQVGPLPWLEAAIPAALADQPDLADHLTQLHQAITARAAQLRADVATEPPAWTAGLGPRPADPVAAERWDDLVSMAAAYRETYNIRTTSTAVPIGPEPGGHGPRAQAWKQITNQWRPIMTTPEDQFSRNQERIGALRDQVVERGEDYRADAEDLAADYLDDAAEDLRTDARATEAAEEEHRYDDTEDIGERNDFSSGLSY